MGIEFQRGEGFLLITLRLFIISKQAGKGRVVSCRAPGPLGPQAKLLMNSLYGRLGPERKNIFNQSAIVEDITAISIHHSISMNLKFESGVKPLKPPGTCDLW